MTALSILAAARQAPDRPALVGAGRVLAFDALAAEARAASVPEPRALAPGSTDRASPGDGEVGLVVLTPRRTVEDVVSIFALIERGVPFVPLHPALTGAERAALAIPSRVSGDVLAVVLTSGSGGAPKPVALSRRAFEASAAASESNLGWRDDDRWLLPMPLSHVAGLSILTRCLIARRCVVLGAEGPFDPRVSAEQLERERVTIASLVPTMLSRLLDLDPPWRPPAHLRAVLLGGAAASAELLARADDREVPVLTTYGLTETCSQVTTQPYGTRNRGQLGAGRPLAGVELRIVAGEIHVRSPALMDGYLGAPDPRTPDGFFPTGDLAELDARGNLHVRGRRTDRIVTGGENVDPLEVERILARCPGVHAACVVGLPDSEWGERVAALVVAPALSEHALDAFAREHLAPHKRPRRYRLVDSLPTTASGKPNRHAARAAFE